MILPIFLWGIISFTFSGSAFSETDESWNVAWIKGKYHLPDYKLAFQIFKIPYKISGGEIEKIELPNKGGDLIAKINAFQDGTLEINVPRNLPYTNGGSEIEDPFFVIVDGKEVNFEEHEKIKCFHILSIPFKNGSQEIEIVGTSNLGSAPIRSLGVPSDCIIKPSPRQQMAGGVLPEDIVCKDGLQLIFKLKDHSPVCVKPQTAQDLLERGLAFYANDTKPIEGKTWVSYYPVNCVKDLCYIGDIKSYYNSSNLQTEPTLGNLKGVDFKRTTEFIKDYYKKQGAEIFDVKYNLVQQSTCELYECWDKYRLDLLVSDSDLVDIYRYGYIISEILTTMIS